MANQHQIIDVLILLLALLVFVPLFQRYKLGTVLAYLLAGVVIGPSGLSLIENVEATRPFAELGVVFLLFTVGLELSLGRLRLFGRALYGLAVSQVIVTTAVLTAYALSLNFDLSAAVVIGGALMLSSTAVVLQHLSERGQLTGQLGRTAVAILIIQDLAVAPMIVLISAIPSSAGESQTTGASTALAFAAAKFALLLLAVWLFDRHALRPLLRLAASVQAPEVFMAVTLLLLLGVGWLTELVGLSMALGALIAGMMVADTEFRHQVAADIQPFRGLLLGLFFMTVGMGLDLAFLAERAGDILAIVAGVMVTKAVILSGLGLAFRLPWSRALSIAGLLSQFSEFSFVLVALAAQAAIISVEMGYLITAAIGISIAVTPLGALLFERLFPAGIFAVRSPLGKLGTETADVAGHVVIVGFGQVGMAVARYLAGEHVPVLVLDLTPRRVSASRTRNLPVFYGNATRIDVLRETHLERAHALVVAIPDPEVGDQVTALARRSFPSLNIFVRAPDETWAPRMRASGAQAVVLEGLTTALDLAERVMLVYTPQNTEES